MHSKKPYTAIAIIALLLAISACTFKLNNSDDEEVNVSADIQPYQIAGSDERKSWCRRKRTHTAKDFNDCVAGHRVWGHAASYYQGVVYENDDQ